MYVYSAVVISHSWDNPPGGKKTDNKFIKSTTRYPSNYPIINYPYSLSDFHDDSDSSS